MMNMQYLREIKTEEKSDVLVCGAGPAGITAAVTAACQGLKTTLLEKAGCRLHD